MTKSEILWEAFRAAAMRARVNPTEENLQTLKKAGEAFEIAFSEAQ